MSAFNASSSILSPSCKSMARLVLPSRLELKRPEGSSTRRPWRRSSSRHSCTSHRCDNSGLAREGTTQRNKHLTRSPSVVYIHYNYAKRTGYGRGGKLRLLQFALGDAGGHSIF